MLSGGARPSLYKKAMSEDQTMQVFFDASVANYAGASMFTISSPASLFIIAASFSKEEAQSEIVTQSAISCNSHQSHFCLVYCTSID